MHALYIIIILFVSHRHVNCGLIPLDINLQNANTSSLDFSLHLPNEDMVQIGLSFRLLSYSEHINKTNNTGGQPTDVDDDDVSTTPYEMTTPATELKLVTVEEAIEGFRQALIKKESEIAGIIESKDVFYRHFKLEFDDDKTITIRCTYDSNYKARSLKISCYEYHEFETERILSNGEVEIIKGQDKDYKSNIELVDLKGMRQAYKMSIS